MSENIAHVTDQNFEQEVLKSDTPVLVDFWAEWCFPCKMISPIIDEIANDYKGKVKIVKLNVDQNPDTSFKYGIKGIPTLGIFKDGELKDQIVGAAPKRIITEKLSYYANIIITL